MTSQALTALLGSTLAAGCVANDAPPPDVGTSSGLALSLDIVGDTDVAGMRFELRPVSCDDGAPIPDAALLVIEKDLEDILLPGGIPEFEGTFDPNSDHVFADAFLVVEAGCYDVTTTPLNADGEPSVDCNPAVARAVQVVEDNTTEVLLINQCDAADPGAIDIGGALNHAPELVNVEFAESKFGERCAVQSICATVIDVDNDPVEFVWTPLTELPFAGPRVVSETQNEDGSVTQCVEIIPQAAGRFEVRVEAYDLFTLAGEPIRVEDFLAGTGNPADSHAELTFPFYAADQGPVPEDEICDGIDNDCDFEIDEGRVCLGDVVGFYDMSLGEGNPTQEPGIVAAGGQPVNITALSADELAAIGVLLVQNPSNGGFGGEYLSQVPAIQEAVSNGLVLIIHDRFVTEAESVLPGGAAFNILRDFADDSNIDILDDSTLVTDGPGGVLDDTSLDGGTSSSHGFAVAGTLPGDSVNIMSRTNQSEIVSMCYGYGQGAVYYSTIPLDFYLAGAGPNPPRDNFAQVYAPNVVAYGIAGACIQ
ncbi:hypothetical protein [Haliangium sp.]|uniref:hypothetical protein n=1 Tax=Haliangium sp. TaxID=2663208 RepID=UPI003D0FF98A